MYGCAIGEASSAMMPTGIKSSAQSQLEPVPVSYTHLTLPTKA